MKPKPRKCGICRGKMMIKLVRADAPDEWLLFYCETCDLLLS